MLEGHRAVLVLVRRDRRREQRIDRKTFGGEADRVGGDIGEAHRAVTSERGDPGIGCGGNHGAQHAIRDRAVVLAHEQIRGQRLRPPTEAGDALNLAVGEPDHNRRHAGDVHQVRLQHAQCHAGCATGINGVSAGLQDRECRRGGQIVAGRDGVAGAIDGGTMAHGGLLGGNCGSLRQSLLRVQAD